ncbi:unnamed protein product, partial [Mesorhabditis belari]|uniref:Autophagy-related protein 6 n=1 Tax=Mesorhabditis belari TaxID=2138241 RepID=A0AAF3EBB0_9BILA
MRAAYEGRTLYTCLNCNKLLQYEEHNKQPRRSHDCDASDLTLNTGEARNLIQIICATDIPGLAPICEMCSSELLEGMEGQLNRLDDECNDLRQLIEALEKMHNSTDPTTVKKRLASLQLEERELRDELRKLADEDRLSEFELQKAREERDNVSMRQEKLWENFRDIHRKLLDNDEVSRRLEAEKRYASEQLHRLSTKSAIDLAFHIWTDGPIATINGFRLGKLPDINVDWNEINAAWGQAALLLDVLLQRLKVEPSMFKLVCMGAHSYIKECRPSGSGREIPLYSSGGWRPFSGQTHSADEGAAAFVDILATLASNLVHLNRTLPHTIRKETLIDNGMQYSVKVQFNNEERWTKAMKCLLSNLKTALVHINSLKEQNPQPE